MTTTDSEVYAIEGDSRLLGSVQWYEEADPEYRRAGLDIFRPASTRGRASAPRSCDWPRGTCSRRAATTGS